MWKKFAEVDSMAILLRNCRYLHHRAPIV